jgi:peptide deformylase
MGIDASKLKIVSYPDKVLRKRAVPVTQVTPEVQAVAKRMIELMYKAEGIGLAAPQVGLSWRLFVVDVPPDEEGKRTLNSDPMTATDGPLVYINPKLSKPEGPMVSFAEGCLSLPEIRGELKRPELITITATDLDGNTFTQRGAGLLARCWQHEFDHLEGVLIIDKMIQSARIKNRAAIRELEQAGGS